MPNKNNVQQLIPVTQLGGAVSGAGATTLLAPALLSKYIVRTGATANFTDTTDTAAQVVLQWPDQDRVPTGSQFDLTYSNATGFVATIAGGTGVTISGISSVPAGSWVKYRASFPTGTTVLMESISAGSAIAGFVKPPLLTSTQSSATAITITAQNIVGEFFLRAGGGGAVNDTLDTATAIIALIPGARVGQSWRWQVLNSGAGVSTILVGAGITLAGTTTITNGTLREYEVRITNVTTPAITVTGLTQFTATV